MPQDTAVPEKETLSDGPPSITLFSWGCDVEEATWFFEVETENWAQSAEVALARDETYLELHSLRSQSAAADGTSDKLRVELDIVADWQDASSGSSSAFLCNTANLEGMNGRLYVYALPEADLADCANFGVESGVLDNFKILDCAETYEAPAEESAR